MIETYNDKVHYNEINMIELSNEILSGQIILR